MKWGGIAIALLMTTGCQGSMMLDSAQCDTVARDRGLSGVDGHCTVGDLKLHYVDHGGKGPPIILLAGLGNSAYIFDEFAPLLTKRHRVIAITRRGYGTSGIPADKDYSNGALVGDILGVMDGLGIRRASFVGHSIAGGEMAAMGRLHPDRVDRLVYLDSAYDRSRALELMAALPQMPPPSKDDRATLDTFAKWRTATLQTRHASAVRADLAAIMASGPGGYTAKASAETGMAVLAGDVAATPRWDAIAAPSLAIFSSKDVADQVPLEASSEQRASFVAASVDKLRPWMLSAKRDFETTALCGVAVEVPRSTHHLFLTRSEATADAILAFLATDRPCAWQSNF